MSTPENRVQRYVLHPIYNPADRLQEALRTISHSIAASETELPRRYGLYLMAVIRLVSFRVGRSLQEVVVLDHPLF